MTRLARNIGYNIAGQTFLLFLGFVASRYVFRRLGEDAFGILYFNLSFSALLTLLLDLGVSSTLIRGLSQQRGDDPRFAEGMARTAGLVCWTSYALLTLLVLSLVPTLATHWIRIQTMPLPMAVEMLRILGVGSLLSLPRSLYTSLFRAKERMGINNAIDVGVSAFQQAGTVTLLSGGHSAITIAVWLSGCSAAGLIAYVLVAARLYSWKALIPGYDAVVIRENLRFSLRMTGITILTGIHTQADKVIVSKALSLGSFGIYSFIYSIASKVTLLTNAVAQSAFPVISRLSAPESRLSLNDQYHKLQDFLCLLTIPFLAMLPFATAPLLVLVFDLPSAVELALPATLLAIGFYMNATLQIPYILSVALGKPEIMLRFNVLALFTILPLQVLLIHWWGLTGAGASWIAYHLLAYAFAVPQLCTSCLPVSQGRWFFETFRALLVSIIVYSASWFILWKVGATRSALPCITAYGGATLFLLPFLWSFASKETRGSCRRFLGGATP